MLKLFPPELRWLFPKVKPQLRLHIASFGCLTGASLLSLVIPLSIRWLIDTILPHRDGQLLLVAIGLMFASYEARSILTALGGYLTFRATQHTALSLRMSLLRRLDSLSAEYFDRTPVGELLYPFEDPIDEISYFGSDLLPSLLRTAVAAGVTLAAMAVLSPFLALVVSPLVPAFLLLRQRYRTRLARQADQVQICRSQVSRFLQEHLSAITQIQLLRQTHRQETKASEFFSSAVTSQDALRKTGIFFSAISNLTIATGMAVVLAWGSLLVFQNRLSIGTLVAFYSLLLQLFEPLSVVIEMYSRAQRVFSSIRQVQAYLEIRPRVTENYKAAPLDLKRSLDVEFRNVSFGYRGKATLLRIARLEILQGERVAIAGPNGAGKSTLGKLLARAYDVDAGEIVMAGRDLRLVTLDSLRSAVCYLPAQPVLFHCSLADNLRLARPESTPTEMERVLRLVGLRSDQCRLAEGFEEIVEPNGSNLSNGERQRVAIARALLQQPRVLILDETTSSLDPASEQAILRAIDQTLPGTTLIVVSHRPDAISSMRRILLMAGGEVVGDGDHASLGEANSFYRRHLASTAQWLG